MKSKLQAPFEELAAWATDKVQALLEEITKDRETAFFCAICFFTGVSLGMRFVFFSAHH